MGTWGVGVLDCDLASDLASDFREIWHEVHDDEKVTRVLLARVGEAVDDPDDGPVVWLALAEIQAALGRLQPDVHAKARDLIASGRALAPFAGTPDEPARRDEIARLSRRLARPAKPKNVPAPPKKMPTRLAVGDVLLWHREHGNVALWVFGISNQSTGTCPQLELLDWSGNTFPRDPSRLVPAAIANVHAKSVGHSWPWYMVFDLKRRNDPERRYEIVATDFKRSGWVESRASAYGLGCRGCTYRGPTANFDATVARDLERIAKQRA